MKKKKWTQEEIAQWAEKNNRFVYCNREDSNIFVRKRNGVAWTLNLRNPISWGMILLLAVIVFLMTAL